MKNSHNFTIYKIIYKIVPIIAVPKIILIGFVLYFLNITKEETNNSSLDDVC